MRLGLPLKGQSRAEEKNLSNIDIFYVFCRKSPKNVKKQEKILFGILSCVIHVYILILGAEFISEAYFLIKRNLKELPAPFCEKTAKF